MEVWKDIKGYEGYYQVSTLGNVRSLDRIERNIIGRERLIKGRRLKPGLTQGYLSVALCINCKPTTKRIHRLVLEAFEDNKHNKPFINHKNSNRADNRLQNLEWCTPSENAIHASLNGRLSHKKLSEQDKVEILEGSKLGVRTIDLARKYGVTSSAISYVKRNYKLRGCEK